MKKQNWFLLLAVIAMSILPLLIVKPSEGVEIFGGADGQAENLITVIRPEYEPWFSPLWEPPSGEIESLLFALQAAIGAGAVGYAVGLFRGRKTAASVK